jgi:mannose-6-phosphate isomerase-like protein (cupin superfamily)
MKTIEKISEGANYTAVSVGKMDELYEQKFQLGPDMVMEGKVFTGQALKASGAEMSFQSFAVGESVGFLHTHKSHEELYIIIKGEGEYQVDGKVFAIGEGSIVRVAPAGKRALRNTGTTPMVMICVQYKANSFGANDAPNEDGVMLNEAIEW